ncbi:MAG TPA: septum formation initiator family protein [Acidimicrobiales bacterium]|nr:septum formation initiator family protein [Acidimicrobiales bacterium]
MKGRAGLLVAALALVGVLALAVFPTTALLDQRRNHKALVAEEAALTAENQALRARVEELGSNEEIERLARQYNLVKPGEEPYFILPQAGPPPAAPLPPPVPEPKGSPSLWDRITSIF